MKRSSLMNRRLRHRFKAVECLEARRLLATFSPIVTANDGDVGSLRAAIIASNKNNQDDSINLATGAYVLNLDNSGSQENAAATGDLDLTDAGHTITIQGKGAGTIIDGAQLDRIFQVFPNVRLVLQNLSLRNGFASDEGLAGHNSGNSVTQLGGAILSGGGSNVTINNVLIENCAAGNSTNPLPAEGGAIYATGALSITNSTLLNNHADAGKSSVTAVDFAQGGAIAAFGSTPLVISGSSFQGNTATGGGDTGAGGGFARGGAIASQVDVNISNSTFTTNYASAGENDTQPEGADASGGALFVDGNATLAQTSFFMNVAAGGISSVGVGVAKAGDGLGGAVYATTIHGSQLTLNDNGASGGQVLYFSTPIPVESVATGGDAAGGGIYVVETSTFTGLNLSRNVADGGEGARGISATSGGSNGGNAGDGGRADGGGIFAKGSLTITNLTCVDNQALAGRGGNGGSGDPNSGAAGSGGLGGTAVGGGINAQTLTITNAHIAGNIAKAGTSGSTGSGAVVPASAIGRTGAAGGISAEKALYIKAADISNNTAQGGIGGLGGYLIVNPPAGGVDGGAGGDAVGGGIYSYQGSFVLINSTVSSNIAAAGEGGRGGGVGTDPARTPTYGTTGGNGGHSLGGGIYVASGSTLTVRNATIARNNAATGVGGVRGVGTTEGAAGADQIGDGGGIYNAGAAASISTIIGDNTAGSGPDFFGHFSAASTTLLENSSGATGIVNGTSGNIVGIDPKLGALANHGSGTFTLLLLPGSPALNHGANPNGLTTDQRGQRRTAGSAIDMGAVEVQAPQVYLSGNFVYAENAPAGVLAPGAIVFDADRVNFRGGKLTVNIKVHANPNDRLEIRNQGVGPGQIGLSGSTIKFGGNVIGTFAGGAGGTPLVITFTTNTATPNAVQALVRAITFRTISDNPSTALRSITFVLSDSDGLSSAPSTAMKTVTVSAKNDAPVLGGGGTTGYTVNQPAVAVLPGGTVFDPDSPNLAGGILKVHYAAGANASNVLSLSGEATLSGNNVLVAGVIVGTRTKSGAALNDLEITFNSSATAAIAQQVLRSITFRATSAPGKRVLSISLSDGDGGNSNAVTKTINVQ